jgi:hypothetical protein
MTTHQQILFGFAAIVLLVLVLELVRRRRLREEYTVFWLLTCAVLIVLAVWRGALQLVARVVGTTLPLSALFGAGFFLVFLIMLHFSTVVTDLWRRNKQMAKEIALLEGTVRELTQQANADKAAHVEENEDYAGSDFESGLRG